MRYTPTDTTVYNTSVTNNVNVTVGLKTLTVTGATAAAKVYDKTFTATVDVGSASLVGVVSPDDVTLSGTPIGTFASSNVANGITVAVSGLTLAGVDAAKYALTQPTTTANITAKSVSVASGLTAVSRIYNGLTSATITSNNVTLSGVIAGDAVVARTNGYTAVFADKHVGTSKTVTVTGMVLGGVSSNNYALTAPTLLASILTTNITVTARTNYKAYDGTTSATNTPTITSGNLQAGDSASWTEAYSSALVGTNNRVLVPAGTVTDGNAGANYNVTFVNYTTGTIITKPLTVTGVTAADKVYDRAFTATIDDSNAALVGVVPPDDVTLAGTPTGTFASSNVANNVTVNISGFTLGGSKRG
ncbi:MAG: YDG domain-containing protein [Verrucomicrobiota bacterium]